MKIKMKDIKETAAIAILLFPLMYIVDISEICNYFFMIFAATCIIAYSQLIKKEYSDDIFITAICGFTFYVGAYAILGLPVNLFFNTALFMMAMIVFTAYYQYGGFLR